METLYDLLQTFPDRGQATALIYRTGVRRFSYSYDRLYGLSRRMATFLASQGVGVGDRVLLWGPNCPGWAVAFWGIVARGAVAVPVDFMSGRERAATIAGLAEVSFVIQSRAKLERLTQYPAMLVEDLETLLSDMEPFAEAPACSPEDMAELIYTSGTTGNPKGVVLTHRNLLANLRQVAGHIPVVTERFRFLSLLPLSHMFEQMGGFLTPLYNGASIVFLQTLKPSAIMAALAEEDIFAVVAVPRLLQLLRSSIERELAAKGLGVLFSRLQRLPLCLRSILFLPIRRKFGRHFTLFVSGGAPLPAELFHFWASLGFTVVEGYGLTECAPVLTANTMERQIPGAVGLPLPGVELRLVREEVQVRGENVFPGYFRNEQATVEAFTVDGWFRTGDLGEVTPAGDLVIKGRAKEVIVTSAGINVYPDEIELLLGAVTGVREACVIGLDRGSGEEVHGVIVPDESGRRPEEVVEEVNRRLDELHQITGWSVWPEAELPKTTTLKVRKFLVRERLAQAGMGSEEVSAPADRLVSIIAQVLGCSPRSVAEDAFLVSDLGLTSIGRLELVNYLEQEYRLDLDEALIGPQTRVRELRAMLARRDKGASLHGLRLWANSCPVRLIRRTMDALLHYPLFRLFVRLRVQGREHLAGLQGPVLFIANHVSYLDQPTIMFALPAKRRYRTATAAWAEFFFVNFHTLGQRLWKRFAFEYCTFAVNVFPLPQSSGFRGTLQHMGRLVDRDISILVFPEGERTQNGKLLPFRQGLGIMATELAIPVVPVAIRGLERVLPRGAHWPRRGEVTVTFGSPLELGGKGAAEIVEMAENVVGVLAGGT